MRFREVYTDVPKRHASRKSDKHKLDFWDAAAFMGVGIACVGHYDGSHLSCIIGGMMISGAVVKYVSRIPGSMEEDCGDIAWLYREHKRGRRKKEVDKERARLTEERNKGSELTKSCS